MDVKITVEVDGKVVQQQVQPVDGTLEQMEETIDGTTRQIACTALQASVEAVAAPRPLFRKREANSGTRATKRGR